MLRAIAAGLAICLGVVLSFGVSSVVAVDEPPAENREAMPLDEFWGLIEKVDSSALNMGEGCDRQAVTPVILALSNRSKEELEAFEERMAQVLYQIDGMRFLVAAGVNSTSDSFLYARAYVVASGRDQYERVLRDPSLMPKSLAQWCEPLLFVARKVWRERTGQDLNYLPSVSFETGSNSSQW